MVECHGEERDVRPNADLGHVRKLHGCELIARVPRSEARRVRDPGGAVHRSEPVAAKRKLEPGGQPVGRRDLLTRTRPWRAIPVVPAGEERLLILLARGPLGHVEEVVAHARIHVQTGRGAKLDHLLLRAIDVTEHDRVRCVELLSDGSRVLLVKGKGDRRRVHLSVQYPVVREARVVVQEVVRAN